MSIHFEDIVYGPIKSRRLGNSLGVNLLPRHGKICSFDCIYCECGWNKDWKGDTKLPSKEDFRSALEFKLQECINNGVPVDTITFSGNGEPTIHPDFPEIIDITLELRDRLFPSAKISVLSNATQLYREGIKEALNRVDNPILKIDSAIDRYAKMIDRPQGEYSVSEIVEQLKWFKGNFILQTMFLKGVIEGEEIDYTSQEISSEWVELVLQLRPRQVMIYTLDRVPPLQTIEKVSVEKMESVAAPLKEAGIDVIIKG